MKTVALLILATLLIGCRTETCDECTMSLFDEKLDLKLGEPVLGQGDERIGIAIGDCLSCATKKLPSKEEIKSAKTHVVLIVREGGSGHVLPDYGKTVTLSITQFHHLNVAWLPRYYRFDRSGRLLAASKPSEKFGAFVERTR